MEIEGKAAVVSGGASGIGRAAVLALAERGAKVVVADLDEDGGRRTVELAGKKGGVTVFCRCDVTKSGDLGSAFGLAVGRFGRLDIAFNNAGIGGEDLFAASLIGLWPMPDAPVYAAAKAGVVNFTRSLGYLAEESGIRVNAICPELVDTPMALELGEEQLGELRSSGGILTPEDIAAGVVELIEDDSRSGAVMQVTSPGGREYVMV